MTQSANASSPVAQNAPTIEHECVINAVIIVVSNEVAAGKPERSILD
jgi:hypothetical protein